MAKTLVAMDEKTVTDNIEGERLKGAFRTCCAVARYFDANGDVTKGFKIRNTGSAVTVKDAEGLLAEAVLLGYNEGAIRNRMTVSAKDAMAAMGIDRERFEAEFGEFIEVKKKSDTLVREY